MTGILMLYAFASASTWPAFLAVGLGFVCSGALFVPIYSIIYRWAEGTHAALDVSLLLGATFLATLPLRAGAPALAGAVGWTVYFAMAVPFYGVAAIVLREAVRRTEITDGSRHDVLLEPTAEEGRT